MRPAKAKDVSPIPWLNPGVSVDDRVMGFFRRHCVPEDPVFLVQLKHMMDLAVDDGVQAILKDLVARGILTIDAVRRSGIASRKQ